MKRVIYTKAVGSPRQKTTIPGYGVHNWTKVGQYLDLQDAPAAALADSPRFKVEDVPAGAPPRQGAIARIESKFQKAKAKAKAKKGATE